MANLKIETMPIGDLTPYHRNPRRGNMAAIAESLKARGQYKPIVVNKGTKTGIANEILAGNHTWQAAKSLGWTTIEAVIVDLDADQAAQIVLADNRIADLGGYDTDALAELLESIEQPTVGTGYSADDIAEIIAAAKPAPTAPKPQPKKAAHPKAVEPKPSRDEMTFAQRMVTSKEPTGENEIPGMAPAQKIIIVLALIAFIVFMVYTITGSMGLH